MYATRRLSQLRKDPDSLSAPPEGPNSGFLVIDDDIEKLFTCCFGLMSVRDDSVKGLPFPQNKALDICYQKSINCNSHSGYNYESVYMPIMFIPVLNQPLSRNRYYAIERQGQNTGKAVTTRSYPTKLDPANLDHQVQISHEAYKFECYTATSVINGNGSRPNFTYNVPLNWRLRLKDAEQFELEDAVGLDTELRSYFLEQNLSLPLSCKSSSPFEVGSWYVPFMFLREGRKVRDQTKRAWFYLTTLEQRWEQIFTCKKNDDRYNRGNSVVVDVTLENQQAYIANGKMALWSEKNADNGVVWFTTYHDTEDLGTKVGLRVEVVERMKWEQERGGWNSQPNGRNVKINRVEEFHGNNEDWQEFGCYVLVERFNFERTDGSLALSYDFFHTNKIKTIWE